MNFQNAKFIASYGILSQLPERDCIEIAFSGRSNVGKSSLINRLCSRKNLAHVSSTPGKTATINYYCVDNIYFVDLPGYGYAKVSNLDRERWDKLINGYFEETRNSRLLIQLLDCRHTPSEDDFQMLEFLRFHHIPFIIVLTKIDKIKKNQIENALLNFEKIGSKFGCKEIFLVSAEKGIGIDALKKYIESVL